MLQTLKQELVTETKKRSGDENGIEHLLHEVLEAHNIKKQHFHGGAMNRVCSRRLLDNFESIFEEINKLTLEGLKIKSDVKDRDVELLTIALNNFKLLFEMMDLVSNL